MKTKQQSQVEFGPDVPNYAVLNEALKLQKPVAKAVGSKQRTPKASVKPNAPKPT
jgi:hypothetical protein